MMLDRTIDKTHPFFDECLQLYLLNLATLAVGLHHETQKDAFRIAENANELLAAPKSEKKVQVWDLPDFPPVLCWQDPNSNEDCLLHVCQSLVDYLRTGTNQPADLRFELVPSRKQCSAENVIQFPAAPDGFEAVDGFVPTTLFETVLCYLVGGAYERFSDRFFAIHDDSTAKWPLPLQFFRHLRNGCFHQNRFRIDQKVRKVNGKKTSVDQIDPANPPKWHGYVMPSDAAMNGMKAVGENGFFHSTHVLPLLFDIGQFTKGE